ncbi:MAG: AAA family ATPase [Myxococcota bacterium]
MPEASRGARIDALLERFELVAQATRSPRRLSAGQQHRLAIAAALAARPDFLLLDEPFAGLDPAARSSLRRVLEAELTESGAALVIASHDLEPLVDDCTHVAHLSRHDREAGAERRASSARALSIGRSTRRSIAPPRSRSSCSPSAWRGSPSHSAVTGRCSACSRSCWRATRSRGSVPGRCGGTCAGSCSRSPCWSA